MRHLRGLPAAIRRHLSTAWYTASIAREIVVDLIHHRTRSWPTDRRPEH